MPTYLKLRTKKKIREKFHYQCTNCGTETNLVHHIDGNCFNNEETNLILLCVDCHNRLHHKKGFECKSINIIRNSSVEKQGVGNMEKEEGVMQDYYKSINKTLENIKKLGVLNLKIPILQPSLGISKIKSPIAIQEENNWERHEQLIEIQDSLLKIQEKALKEQKKAIKEQRDTYKITIWLLVLTFLSLISVIILKFI